jgi:hypothetical protein
MTPANPALGRKRDAAFRPLLFVLFIFRLFIRLLKLVNGFWPIVKVDLEYANIHRERIGWDSRRMPLVSAPIVARSSEQNGATTDLRSNRLPLPMNIYSANSSIRMSVEVAGLPR